jgi:hypothetical protein
VERTKSAGTRLGSHFSLLNKEEVDILEGLSDVLHLRAYLLVTKIK